MAVNFLIALAAAFGSATIILLAVIAALKIFKPESFAETIPRPQGQHFPGPQGTVSAEALHPPLIIDTATLTALSGEQIASLVGYRGQSPQVLIVAPAIAQSEIRSLPIDQNEIRFLPAVVDSLRGRQSGQQASAQQVRDKVLYALTG